MRAFALTLAVLALMPLQAFAADILLPQVDPGRFIHVSLQTLGIKPDSVYTMPAPQFREPTRQEFPEDAAQGKNPWQNPSNRLFLMSR